MLVPSNERQQIQGGGDSKWRETQKKELAGEAKGKAAEEEAGQGAGDPPDVGDQPTPVAESQSGPPRPRR